MLYIMRHPFSCMTPHLICHCRTASLIKSGKLADISVEDTQRNYKRALQKGVLKIMSKMGISLLSCYHGAQIFEIYGLGQEVVDTAFRGSVSRIGGMNFDELQKEVESFWIKVCMQLMQRATLGKTQTRLLAVLGEPKCVIVIRSSGSAASGYATPTADCSCKRCQPSLPNTSS